MEALGWTLVFVHLMLAIVKMTNTRKTQLETTTADSIAESLLDIMVVLWIFGALQNF